jgi:dTDP-glucose 4,6-dehydratase
VTKVLITGGAGFIGSNFIRFALGSHSDWDITNLDKLTYAGNLENLKDIEGNPRYRFVKGDIADAGVVGSLLSQGFEYVVNFAAESHVDRSIIDASPFIKTNVEGVQTLLEAVRRHEVRLFVQISTDEVYGSLGKTGRFSEKSPLEPNSPYAASKASADLICRAYYHTHNLPIIITRSCNNLGPYQSPEKLIPLVITNALENREIPLYGDGLNVRDWIYVLDNCRGIDLATRGKPGEVYNIGANSEKTNLELVSKILGVLKRPESLIRFVKDRPGHDRRYSLDATKITRELGFKPAFPFDKALEETVEWYIANESWWKMVKKEKYRENYDRKYSER